MKKTPLLIRRLERMYRQGFSLKKLIKEYDLNEEEQKELQQLIRENE